MHVFDTFSHDYEGNLDHPIRRWFGLTNESLLLQKIDCVREALLSHGGLTTDMRILDYGSGTGDFLRALGSRLHASELLGMDVSEGMIAEAKSRHADSGTLFRLIRKDIIHEHMNSFDVAVISSVLHHIDRNDWTEVLQDIFGFLKPEGRLVIIEHNPLNLATQLVVKTTPVDKGVSLIRPGSLDELMKSLNFVMTRPRYFLVYPPAWPGSSHVDKVLGALPIGGQWISIVSQS